MSDNYYQMLGVPPDANLQEIKSAYKAMAMKYHPDRNPDNPQAEEQFKIINEIYQTLSDPYKRSAYDYLLLYRNHQTHTTHYTASQTNYQPPQTPYYQNTAQQYTSADPTAHIPKHTKRIIILAVFAVLLGICVVAVMLYRFSQQLHSERVLETAKAQINQNDKLSALKNLNIILSQPHPELKYLEMRAEICLGYRNYWKATEDYTQLLKLSKESEPQWYFNRGKAHFYLFRYEAARKDFDQAISLDSTQPSYFMYRAILKKRMTQSTQSICEDWQKGQKAAKTFYHEEMRSFCP